MRIVLQRVTSASVTVDGVVTERTLAHFLGERDYSCLVRDSYIEAFKFFEFAYTAFEVSRIYVDEVVAVVLYTAESE